MNAPLQVRIYDRDQLVFSEEFDGVIEMGRQSEAAERAYTRREEGGQWRLVIARMEEQAVSRHHALVEPMPGGRVRVTNISALIPLVRSDNTELAPGASAELALPTSLSVGRKCIQICESEPEPIQVKGLPDAAPAPGAASATEYARLRPLHLPRDGRVDAESLVRWLRSILGVLQTAASTSDFFDRAARAVVDVAGMDSGRVLLFEGEGWRTEAVSQSSALPANRALATVDPSTDWRPSRRVLNKVRTERRTFWEEPEGTSSGEMSLVGVTAVVAAPILDRNGDVIGALYGERRQGTRTGPEGAQISHVDAMMVELVATGVAAGLARVDQERAAMAARVQFEQFFTPELARELTSRPDLLKGQERDVTLLFADIRGFSRFSEKIGPARTLEWIGDVMGVLSDCVIAHSGVLVDYIGDEIIAMWGAPQAEPNHPRLACRAALEMLARIPELNARWGPVLGEPMSLGIGVNTGLAQVGNTGSSRKFKYGALGNTVNLASRVQGATKYIKVPLLVTGSTRARLDANFAVRQICRVEVVNIAEPVTLFELVATGLPGWEKLRKGYEEAHQMYEKGEFRPAAQRLGNLLNEFPEDAPSLLLMSRAVDSLIRESPEFDPVWRLPGK